MCQTKPLRKKRKNMSDLNDKATYRLRPKNVKDYKNTKQAEPVILPGDSEHKRKSSRKKIPVQTITGIPKNSIRNNKRLEKGLRQLKSQCRSRTVGHYEGLENARMKKKAPAKKKSKQLLNKRDPKELSNFHGKAIDGGDTKII